MSPNPTINKYYYAKFAYIAKNAYLCSIINNK